MAIVTWNGGMHNLSGPGVWSPAPPVAGDEAVVQSGVQHATSRPDVTTIAYLNQSLLLDGGSHGAINLVAPSGASFSTSSFVLTHQGAASIITTHNTIV